MASFLPFYNNDNSDSNRNEEGESCFPTLSYKERIIGFLACFILGFSYYFNIVKKFLFFLFKKKRNCN